MDVQEPEDRLVQEPQQEDSTGQPQPEPDVNPIPDTPTGFVPEDSTEHVSDLEPQTEPAGQADSPRAETTMDQYEAVGAGDDAPVDEEFIALARRNKVIYCPTLFVYHGYQYALSNTWRATPAEERRADPEILAAMDDLNEIPADKLPARVAKAMSEAKAPTPPTVAMQNLRKLLDAGITVVMGTDAGNIGTLHGPSILREMRLMQDSGLTPLEVLRTATTNGARVLGQAGELGAIAPGRLVDLVVLDADPLVDSANLGSVHRVIKDGRVYDPEALLDF